MTKPSTIARCITGLGALVVASRIPVHLAEDSIRDWGLYKLPEHTTLLLMLLHMVLWLLLALAAFLFVAAALGAFDD